MLPSPLRPYVSLILTIGSEPQVARSNSPCRSLRSSQEAQRLKPKYNPEQRGIATHWPLHQSCRDNSLCGLPQTYSLQLLLLRTLLLTNLRTKPESNPAPQA